MAGFKETLSKQEEILAFSSWQRLLAQIFLPVILSLSLLGQSSPKAIVVPESDHGTWWGNVDVFSNQPPDLTLIPQRPGARQGRLWIRNDGYALRIAGEVDGDPPDFPRNKNWILSKDHIEVWLAATADVPMPDIGWGNQSQEMTLPEGEDSCADIAQKSGKNQDDPAKLVARCQRWVRTQERYRKAFKRLFVRQWLLTEVYAIEAFATPAYDEITTKYAGDQAEDQEQIPTILKPQGKVQMWWMPAYQTGKTGYTFQIQIPYSAFPPLHTLQLSDLRLMVDVYSAAPEGEKFGPFSSTSANRRYGSPQTFNLLRLKPARAFQMTACDLGLTEEDAYGNQHKGWFIPKVGYQWEQESDDFIIVNEARGSAYDYDGLLSPIIRPIHHFWTAANKEGTAIICGPSLAYRRGASFREYDVRTTEAGFETRHLQNGDLLIKVGPDERGSEFGSSGECGACPRAEMRIYALNPKLKLSEALNLYEIVDGSQNEAVDFSVSPDWSTVTEYVEGPYREDKEPLWSSVTYCLKGSKYEKCDEKTNVQPPQTPH
jgi:hypothetical protein